MIEITDEVLDNLEAAMTPAGKDGVTRMTYFLNEMSDETNQTSTPDVIKALISKIRELQDQLDGEDETTS